MSVCFLEPPRLACLPAFSQSGLFSELGPRESMAALITNIITRFSWGGRTTQQQLDRTCKIGLFITRHRVISLALIRHEMSPCYPSLPYLQIVFESNKSNETSIDVNNSLFTNRRIPRTWSLPTLQSSIYLLRQRDRAREPSSHLSAIDGNRFNWRPLSLLISHQKQWPD